MEKIVSTDSVSAERHQAVSPPVARHRVRLQLSPGERKTMLFVVDLLLVNASLLIAVSAWNGFEPSLSQVWASFKWFATLSVVWLAAGLVLDVYNLVRAASTTNILASTGLAALLASGIYVAIPWLTPPILTRSYVLGFVLLSTVALCTWRALYALALVRSAFHQRALLLGMPASVQGLVLELQRAAHAKNANPFRGSGYEIVGLVSHAADEGAPEIPGLPHLGEVHDLASLAARCGVDEVIVAMEGRHLASVEVHEALLDCRELDLQVKTLSEVYERLTARLPVAYSQLDMDMVLGPLDSPTYRMYGVVKRAMDLLLGLVGLAAMAAVIPGVALANALWSPGPLFYRQTRTGKGGRSFVIYKFRSMVVDAEKYSGVTWSEDDDPRITKVGRWLRKTRLDELPQFINVLRGEMSAVGPRPERPSLVGRLTRELPLYRARHAVKPGVSGWAQIRYRYGNSIEDARRKLEYDLYYVKHANLYLDLMIVLQTARVVLRLRGK
jgi:exopolysaccharide biosynthesis polyprenyl glycosylphosphotransferase